MTAKPAAIRVARPPAKPLMIYDGDCGFCKFWIRRWDHATHGGIEFIPFQDARVGEQYPELAREHLAASVHLVATDGQAWNAAAAVFQALALNPCWQWLLWLYERVPGFAAATEYLYRFVAGHRALFSTLTRLGWGLETPPSEFQLVRWVFLRLLGVIYLVAFVSLGTQIMGLVGSQGITPAAVQMESAQRYFDQAHTGWDRYHLLPTLCWFNAGDGFLKFLCGSGVVLSVLVIANISPAVCLFLLWLIYLSLSSVCGVFLGFQWDALLLETGWLAIFFAPWQVLPRIRAAPPSRLVLWLLRWLLFRLMFESGLVKLLSHDETWRHLTALNFHYETQPLPTWIGWYAHQLPPRAQAMCVFLMFAVELGAPWLMLAPRRLRFAGCGLLVLLQVIIFLTGNYCFFNLLTIALCLLLLDDAALQKFVPKKWRVFFSKNAIPSTRGAWPGWVIIPVGIVILLVTVPQVWVMVRDGDPRPAPQGPVARWVAPLESANVYGLFMVMTTNRLEIILEGSNDGQTWLAYEFKYKPGDLKRRPGFVAPHQPRLDWQMWFAALGNYRQNPWCVNLCVRLLQGSRPVLALLKDNPFPNDPPRYIRAEIYEYNFTNPAERRATGNWWRRKLKGEYLPAISLRAN